MQGAEPGFEARTQLGAVAGDRLPGARRATRHAIDRDDFVGRAVLPVSRDAMAIEFGEYSLCRRIGSGGMAEVWSAQRATASGGKACAVKLIHLAEANEAEYRDLFIREGALTMKLRHGNVVPVFDVGEQDGTLYMAMELVDGVPLDRFVEHVRRGDEQRPNLAEVVHIVSEVLRALHYVHTFTIADVNQHIVHRDVSPQNILVTSSGEIKLTDFGIARMVDGRTTGRIYGKLNYMPREQLEGNPVPASDLFALGAVFYELVARQRFRAGCTSQGEHREAIIAGVVPALSLSLPPEIETALRDLLEVDLQGRAQSAKAVLNVLGAWSEARNMSLALEELYLDSVDSRHSWYTAATAQARPEPAPETREPPVPEGQPRPEGQPQPEPPIEKTAAGRLRAMPRATGEDDEPTVVCPDLRAPERGREHEPAKPHVAARCIDEVTTSRWERPQRAAASR